MSKRDALIKTLMSLLNETHDTSLTFEQVENWVGSDTSESGIQDHIYDFKFSPESAVTPDDVMELWDEASDEVLQRYNHAYDLNIEIISSCCNASDVTGAALKQAFQKKLDSMTDEEFRKEANRFDTFEVEINS